METATCRHCGRHIEQVPDGTWRDPEANGDDSIWRYTCDGNPSFTAEHEPKVIRIRDCYIAPAIGAVDVEDES